MSEERTNETGWHLDKRVPLAIIGAMALQLFAAGAGWQSLTSKQLDQDRRLRVIEETMTSRDNEARRIYERMATVEANTSNMLRTLDRIERRLDDTQIQKPSPLR